MLSEINNFFDNILQWDDVAALLNIIPTSLKVLILAGSAFSCAIAIKRTIIG